MKPLIYPLLTATLVASAALTPAAGQSVGRIRRSLDKATGGATQPTATSRPSTTAASASASTSQAQIAANEAAANQRNKAAQVGVDDRVVAFLKQRIEDGSADAPVDLAKRYEEGKGVTEDPVEARRLYTLAAERGNEEAITWLQANPKPEKPAQETARLVTTAAPAESPAKTDGAAPAKGSVPVVVPKP